MEADSETQPQYGKNQQKKTRTRRWPLCDCGSALLQKTDRALTNQRALCEDGRLRHNYCLKTSTAE